MKTNLLGKVFISHSSVDKPFVRRLARRIEKEGFQIWLDERELVPGDSLSTKISEALETARVTVVVASKASVKSRWLTFELNKATSRMIKGECRLIPVVIDKESLPSEVAGLLYADFTNSFDFGMRAVLTALKSEVAALEQARQKAIPKYFFQKVDLMLTEIFGTHGYCSVMGEYESVDYRSLSIPIPMGNSDETDVAYETVDAFGKNPKPLSEQWWSEYQDATERIPARLFLVISKRPIAFKADKSTASERLRVSGLSDWRRQPRGYIVVADLSSLNSRSQLALLKKSRALLLDLGRTLVGADGRIPEP